MKKVTCCMLLALSLVACKENEVEEPQMPVLESRAITPGMESETNPTLLTDWENCTTIYLNSLGANGSPNSETAPWANASMTSLEESFRKDIKKADGWQMLFHTFCRSNLDRSLSYMCLYNIFTGYIKVFYYSEDRDLGKTTRWTISSNAPEACQGLFSENAYFAQPVNNPIFSVWSVMADNCLNASASGAQKGWNGFQFRIGEYRPNIAPRDLTIQAYNYSYTNFNFNGETKSETTGTIKTINSTNKSILNNPISKAVVNYAGEGAKEVVDKYVEKHPNKSFLGFNLKSITEALTKSDYVSAITKGLGFLFGKTSTKTTYSISEVELQTHGTVAIKGTGETQNVSQVAPFTFNLDEVLEAKPFLSQSDVLATLSQNSGQKFELGVWNLREKPTVYYERYTKFEDLSGMLDFNASPLEFHGLVEYPLPLTAKAEIVFNPIIKPYVKSYSMKIGFIDVVGGNRNLDHKGKAIIGYNTSNKLNEIGDVTVYGIDKNKRDLFMMIETDSSVNLNDNTQYYVDWGGDVAGNVAAVVSVTMNIEYEGKQLSITDSRVYDVNYAPSPNSLSLWQVNNPPMSFLINSSNNTIYSSNLK